MKTREEENEHFANVKKHLQSGGYMVYPFKVKYIFKEDSMESRIVKTKEQLQKAYDEKVDKIIVEGKLAKKIKKTQKLKYVTMATVAGLGGAIAIVAGGIATAPMTGGVSLAVSGSAVAAISAQTGLSFAAVIMAVSVGVSLLVAVFKDYDVEVRHGKDRVILKKK